MSFLAGTLLMFMDEFTAFQCLVSLLARPFMSTLYHIQEMHVTSYFHGACALVQERGASHARLTVFGRRSLLAVLAKVPAARRCQAGRGGHQSEHVCARVVDDDFHEGALPRRAPHVARADAVQSLPLRVAFRIWDLFMLDGEVVIFRTSIGACVRGRACACMRASHAAACAAILSLLGATIVQSPAERIVMLLQSLPQEVRGGARRTTA
jgi:hypothetical protein